MTTARRDPKKKTEYGTTYRFIGYHYLILWERGEGRVSTKKQSVCQLVKYKTVRLQSGNIENKITHIIKAIYQYPNIAKPALKGIPI